MEWGGGVRNDSGKSLHCALFQLPRVERGTPGPRKQFLWEWTLTSGFLNPGRMFSQRLNSQAKSPKPSAVKHPCRLHGAISGNAAETTGPDSYRGAACSPALE